MMFLSLVMIYMIISKSSSKGDAQILLKFWPKVFEKVVYTNYQQI